MKPGHSTAAVEAAAPSAEPKLSQTELWRCYHQHGPGHSSEAQLVERYLPLVKTVVGRLAMCLPSHLDSEDLYSAGLVGLLQAIRHYNPQAGTAFEAYARLRIRGAVLDELRRMDWAPRSVHAKARKVQAAMAELEQAKGRLPTDEEMAEALGLSVPEYAQWLEAIRPVTFVSLDVGGLHDDDEAVSEHEMLSDEAQTSAADQVSRQELARIIAQGIKRLPEFQRKILALYYFEDLRLREIAAICGCSESHICQTHARAIMALRAYIKRYEVHAFKSPLRARP